MIGSTGFLGYYTVLELLRHGHEIDSLSLTPTPDQVPFPTEIGLTLADFNQLDDEVILNKLTGFDGLIFAAGADDRSSASKARLRVLQEIQCRCNPAPDPIGSSGWRSGGCIQLLLCPFCPKMPELSWRRNILTFAAA